MNNEETKILYFSFNQDASCINIGTSKGFKIFNTSPLELNYEREFDGGIGIVEILNKSNICVLVGGGKHPKYSPNKIIIWDDHLNKVITEIRFFSNILLAKIKKDRLIVVIEKRIYLFDITNNFENIDTIDTCDNSKGVLAYTPLGSSNIIAYPEKTIGLVRIKFYDRKYSQIIQAHESGIAFLTFNIEGTLLASSSDKGTLIRIFNSHNGEMLQEVRRGSDKASINHLYFNSSSTLISCTSDKSTIHIFSSIDALEKIRQNKSNEEENDKELQHNKTFFWKAY